MIAEIFPWAFSAFLFYASREAWQESKAMMMEETWHYYGIAFLNKLFSVFFGVMGFVILYELIKGLM